MFAVTRRLGALPFRAQLNGWRDGVHNHRHEQVDGGHTSRPLLPFSFGRSRYPAAAAAADVADKRLPDCIVLAEVSTHTCLMLASRCLMVRLFHTYLTSEGSRLCEPSLQFMPEDQHTKCISIILRARRMSWCRLFGKPLSQAVREHYLRLYY